MLSPAEEQIKKEKEKFLQIKSKKFKHANETTLMINYAKKWEVAKMFLLAKREKDILVDGFVNKISVRGKSSNSGCDWKTKRRLNNIFCDIFFFSSSEEDKKQDRKTLQGCSVTTLTALKCHLGAPQ